MPMYTLLADMVCIVSTGTVPKQGGKICLEVH